MLTKEEVLYKDLKKALRRLREAIGQPPTIFNQDATIKRFEFCFELSWKLMKTIAKKEGINVPSPKAAIRQAADLDLIRDPKTWFKFLAARNLTVHTYKEEVAQKVYQKAKEFVPYVSSLITAVKKYVAQNV